MGKISPPPVFDLRTVQPVASRYTDWAIPAHCLQGSAAEIEIQTHRNLIGRSKPAPSPVLSPNSIRPSSSIWLRFHSHQEKIWRDFQTCFWFSYFLFKSLKSEFA